MAIGLITQVGKFKGKKEKKGGETYKLIFCEEMFLQKLGIYPSLYKEAGKEGAAGNLLLKGHLSVYKQRLRHRRGRFRGCGQSGYC